MSGCESFSRIFIGLVNLIIIAGAIFCAVVLYPIFKENQYYELIASNTAAIAVLVVVVIVLISAVIGITILFCKNLCLRKTYLGVLILAVIIEIVGVILAFLYKNQALNAVEENWTNPDFSIARKATESTFKCCGFATVNTTDCGYESPPADVKQCKDTLVSEISKNVYYVGGAIIAFLVLEIALLVMSIYLVSSYDNPVNNGPIDYD